MKADEFLTTYNVHTNFVHLADLDTWSPEGASTQRVWVLMLSYNDGMSDRLLTLDWRTSAAESTDTMDAANAFAALALDAQEGNRSFDDYLIEHYNPHTPGTPADHYATWIIMVWLRHRFDDWCRDDQMRSDFHDLQLW